MIRQLSLHEPKSVVLTGFAWCVALCSLLPAPSPAAPAFSADDFKGDGICQFALHGLTLTPQTRKAVNASVQKLITRHRQVFGFRVRPDFRLRFRVFSEYEDYTNAAFQVYFTNATDRRVLRNKAFNVAGFYTTATREVVTWRQKIPGFLGTTLLHESSHAILDAHYRHVPMWMLEGSADYLAFALHPLSDLNKRLLERRWSRLYHWLQQGELLSFQALLDADGRHFQRLDPEKSYSMSWSFFQFLMSSINNKRMMKSILQEAQVVRRPSFESTATIDRLYPGGLPAFEQAWHRWIIRRARTIAPAKR